LAFLTNKLDEFNPIRLVKNSNEGLSSSFVIFIPLGVEDRTQLQKPCLIGNIHVAGKWIMTKTKYLKD
jgi:hypothetical protein